MSATRTSPKPRKSGPSAQKTPKRRNLVLPIALGVIVLLGLVAIVVSRSGGDSEDDPTPLPPGVTIAETQPVEISGAALSDYKAGEDTAVGTQAPVASGSTFDGSPIEIGEPGTPQLVFFVAHWCPHCQKEVPVITTWIEDNGLPGGIELKAVSTGVNKDAPNYPPSEWLEREDWPVDTLADDEASTTGQAYGLTGYPFFVAIDADGNIAARGSGELGVDEIEALVAAAKS